MVTVSTISVNQTTATYAITTNNKEIDTKDPEVILPTRKEAHEIWSDTGIRDQHITFLSRKIPWE